MESDTPIGFLQGAGGISSEISHLMELAAPIRPGAVVLFDDSPVELVKSLTKALDEEYSKYKEIYA